MVASIGKDVRNLHIGDRAVIPSTIACGYRSYCRADYYAQCDNANSHGKQAGTAFYGGPEQTGPFNGLQAEKACIPMAAVNLVKLPDEVTDAQALLLSDIWPCQPAIPSADELFACHVVIRGILMNVRSATPLGYVDLRKIRPLGKGV